MIFWYLGSISSDFMFMFIFIFAFRNISTRGFKLPFFFRKICMIFTPFGFWDLYIYSIHLHTQFQKRVRNWNFASSLWFFWGGWGFWGCLYVYMCVCVCVVFIYLCVCICNGMFLSFFLYFFRFNVYRVLISFCLWFEGRSRSECVERKESC